MTTEKEKVQKVVLAAREKLSIKQLRETLEGMGYLVFLSVSGRTKKTTMSVNIPEVCHVGTWTV